MEDSGYQIAGDHSMDSKAAFENGSKEVYFAVKYLHITCNTEIELKETDPILCDCFFCASIELHER